MIGKRLLFTKKVGKVLRLNHIAIATADSSEHAKFYRDILKLSVSEKKPQPEHGVFTTFIDCGNVNIELLEQLGGDSSPIAGFMKKHPKGGVHHFCFEVDDLTAVVENLRSQGITPLSDPKPGAHGMPVVFLHPKDCNGILVELEQRK